MIRLLFALAALLVLQTTHAQNPVRWEYSSKKITADKYEIRIKATIGEGWHIYSTTQSDEGIGLPTSITFNKNPLVTITGKIKEEGKLEKRSMPDMGITNMEFKDTVTFVQTVTLKNKVKTTVSGKVDYMACTEEKCLPPASVSFSVKIGE